MATIEITAAIRRNRAEIYSFLHDLHNYKAFLPGEHFDHIVSGDAVMGRNAVEMRWRALGRWWAAAVEIDSSQEGERLVLRNKGAGMPFSWTWTLSDLKKDRKGDKTEVHLKVEAWEPGGMVGKLLTAGLLEKSMIRTFDAVLRNLEDALGAKPRSGLRAGKDE